MSRIRIDFDHSEAKFLGGSLIALAKQTGMDMEKQAYYMFLIEQLKGLRKFKMNELQLLLGLTEQSLLAGANLLATTADLEVRIKAQAIIATFNAVEGKLKHGIQQLQTESREDVIHSEQSSVQRKNQDGGSGDLINLPGSTGRGSADRAAESTDE